MNLQDNCSVAMQVLTDMSKQILEFLNVCISFNIGLINTKLDNVANSMCSF